MTNNIDSRHFDVEEIDSNGICFLKIAQFLLTSSRHPQSLFTTTRNPQRSSNIELRAFGKVFLPSRDANRKEKGEEEGAEPKGISVLLTLTLSLIPLSRCINSVVDRARSDSCCRLCDSSVCKQEKKTRLLEDL